MKKPILVISLLSLIILGLVVSRVSLINSISTRGIQLVDLQNQLAYYKNENELLKVQYLQAASYTNISQQAAKLGYVPVSTDVDLASPPPLALR
jgi:competence protein ComGC